MIRFDRSYRNIFLVNDPRQRADALRDIILPQMTEVLQQSLTVINNVYRIDALEDSRISWYPRFRKNRVSELSHVYEEAFVGLGGRQEAGKWKGVVRKDGKIVQLLPFRMGFVLNALGLRVELQHNWLKGLSAASYRKILNVVVKNESLIYELCRKTGMDLANHSDGQGKYISTLAERCKSMADNIKDPSFFESETSKYPISETALNDMIAAFTVFFPVYDTYLRLAMGKPSRFKILIDRLNSCCANTK